MKNDFPIKVMVGLLALMVLAGAALSWLYVQSVREARQLQARAAIIQKDDLLIRSLLNDLVEYSKRNPDIIPLLQQYGVQPQSPATPPPPT
ncbi:MAG: hypothetical protein ACK4UN_17165, partial [Limisphaerales bacterium]